ncbi:Cell cycle protein GpsB [compost metagenome]
MGNHLKVKYTPLDIRMKSFSTRFRGYNQEEVDNFLLEVMKDQETLTREVLYLREQLEKSGSKEYVNRWEYDDLVRRLKYLENKD